MLRPIKKCLKGIPGVLPAYNKMREMYYECCDTWGFVPNKECVVSKAYWDNRALENWDYDRQEDVIYTQSMEELVEELQSLEWNSLLEAGCGYGRVLSFLSERFPSHRLVGIDFSRHQLARAKTYLGDKPVELRHVEAKEIPFSNHEFDVLLTSAMLIYVHPSELSRTLEQFARVSRRYLVLSEYTRDFLDSLSREQLLKRAPFYGHRLVPALEHAGIQVVKAGLMRAWDHQPDRLPLSLIIGKVGGSQ